MSKPSYWVVKVAIPREDMEVDVFLHVQEELGKLDIDQAETAILVEKMEIAVSSTVAGSGWAFQLGHAMQWVSDKYGLGLNVWATKNKVT